MSSRVVTIGTILIVAAATAACTTDLQNTTTSILTTTSRPNPGSPLTSPSVDPVLEDAVAPFDHDSAVAWQQTEARLAKPTPGYISHVNHCLAAAGFDPLPPLPDDVPDKDNVIWLSNWQFPKIDELHANGFPSLEVEDSMLTGEEEDPDPVRDEALASCIESAGRDFADTAHSLAIQTFAFLRGEWERILTEIDNSEEVQAELEKFAACLIADGIPDEWTGSTTDFLNYVDEQLWQADDDEQIEGDIRFELGQLYAECSESMFELKLKIRSGSVREEFLKEHAPTLQALSQLISGEVPPGYSVPTSPETAWAATTHSG